MDFKTLIRRAYLLRLLNQSLSDSRPHYLVVTIHNFFPKSRDFPFMVMNTDFYSRRSLAAQEAITRNDWVEPNISLPRSGALPFAESFEFSSNQRQLHPCTSKQGVRDGRRDHLVQGGVDERRQRRLGRRNRELHTWCDRGIALTRVKIGPSLYEHCFPNAFSASTAKISTTAASTSSSPPDVMGVSTTHDIAHTHVLLK